MSDPDIKAYGDSWYAATMVEAPPRPSLSLDLDVDVCVIGGGLAEDLVEPFQIDDYTRWRLMEGLDDIGLTLRHSDAVDAFEAGRPSWLPAVL